MRPVPHSAIAGEIFARIDAPTGVNFPVEKDRRPGRTGFYAAGHLAKASAQAGDVAAFTNRQFQSRRHFSPASRSWAAVPLDMIFKLVPFGFPGQAGDRVSWTDQRAHHRGHRRREHGRHRDALRLETSASSSCSSNPSLYLWAMPSSVWESVIDTPLDGKTAAVPCLGRIWKNSRSFFAARQTTRLIGAQFDHIRFCRRHRQKSSTCRCNSTRSFLRVPLSFVNEIRKYIPLDGFCRPALSGRQRRPA